MKPFSRDFLLILKILGFAGVIVWLGLFWYLRNPIVFAKSAKQEAIEINPKVLESKVRALTEISPPRQYKNEKSMLAAENFVEREFAKLGYSVSKQEVLAFDHVYHNLIVRYGDPSAKEIVVLGAHYDVCDDQPGADDNATGVAGVIELASLLKEKNPKLTVPIELVIYSLEEPPFFGSQEMGSAVHADSLKANGVTVKYMVSLEMIGYYSNKLFSQHFSPPLLYAFYPWTGDFIGIVGSPADRELAGSFKTAMASNAEIPVISINAPRILPGVDFSDHRSYWNHDWPAIMVTDTAFLRNNQYHLPGDTPERLDYKSMAEVIRGVYSAVVLTNSQ
jgi:hypothetical protein